MNVFDNIKTGTKIFGGVFTLLAILIVVSVIGGIVRNTMVKRAAEMYKYTASIEDTDFISMNLITMES